MRAPSISIGDLALAVRRLEIADQPTLEQVAEALGLRAAVAGAARTDVVPPPPPPPSPPPQPPKLSGPPAAAPPGAGRDRAAVPADVRARPTTIEELRDDGARRRPRRVQRLSELLAPPAPPAAAARAAAAADGSLFVPRWQRGIVTAAISSETPDGPIDVTAIADTVANGRAVERLPRLPLRTTRKGLLVLADMADGMRPFAGDVAQLERVLRLTAGDDGVAIKWFEGHPLDECGSGRRSTWEPYAPPPAGTPVLVVSDFGLASSAASAAAPAVWTRVAAMSETCPMLALTPFPPDRWPSWLTQLFSPIHWERTTNATAARRAADRAARRRR